MRILLASLLLLGGVLAAIPAARAGDTVYRCVDAHGSPVFSDQPCTALAATPVQAPAGSAGAAASGAAVPLAGCTATPALLRARVIQAFATHDPNRLAGLMVWRGYGGRAAVGDIQSLAVLVRQPLIGIRFGTGGDPADGATSPTPPAPGNGYVLQVRTGGVNGRTVRFDVSRQAGCLWLHPAG